MSIAAMAVLPVLCQSRGLIDYIGQIMGDRCALTGKHVPLSLVTTGKWWILTETSNTRKRLFHQFLLRTPVISG